MSSNKDGRDKKGGPTDSGHPTIVPPFAPEELAQKPEAKRTPGAMRAVRDPQVTLTDEVELEIARQRSMEVSVPPTPEQPVIREKPVNPETEMRERYDLGDFGGALEVAERLLAVAPANADANRIARDCREQLTELNEARLGSLDRVPSIVVADEDLKHVAIDHRAGFLLSHIDGVSSLETILDVSGMPRLDALRILVELVQKRVVALR